MPFEVIMPKVDMDMTSGKLMAWHVTEGTAVTKGTPLFDIETDKAAMEIESPADGVVHHMLPEGTEVPIGQPVAWLFAPGEAIDEPPEGYHAAIADAEPESASVPVSMPVPVPVPGRHVQTTPPETTAPDNDLIRATPLARKRARDVGLDLAEISGTGPRGRVQAQDIPDVGRPAAPVLPAGFTPDSGPLATSHSRGGTGTPIVLIHGFAGDSLSFAPLNAHLSHRPLIRIELPGHGKSPKLAIRGFSDLLGHVRQCFDALNLDTAHLIGHSLGGALAMGLADTRPRKVVSMSLLAPAGLGPEVNGTVLDGICRASRAQSLGPWLKQLVSDDTLVTDAFARLAMEARQDPNLRAAQTAMADALFADSVQAFDLRAALDRAQMPTRIIWGKRDKIVPWSHALTAPGRVALHLFDQVGHVPHLEIPDEVGQILQSAV